MWRARGVSKRNNGRSNGWTSTRDDLLTIVRPGGKRKTTLTRPQMFPSQEEVQPTMDITLAPNYTMTDTSVQNQPIKRPHKQRKEIETRAWVSALPEMKEAYLESLTPVNTSCCSCKQQMKEILLCQDCGPTSYFCRKCFHERHEFSPLHVPFIWVVGSKGSMYLPYVWDKELSLPDHRHHLNSTTYMTIIDQFGRQHDVKVGFCACISKPAALIKLGLWPATPTNPVTAIDLRFMQLCRCMLLEGGVAVYKFAAIMRMFGSYLPNKGDKKSTYNAIAMDTVAYHRRFVYDINYLQGIVPGHPDGSECLVCAETDGMLPRIISMDGNFRLVRKKTAGTSTQEPHHQVRFFLRNEEVEPFLRNQTCAHDTDCSDFKAGTPSRAAYKADKLDVTGLFGSICIHDFPQMFINMNSGEKLGYAVSIINKLKQNTADVKVLYDVACRILPQLNAAKVKISTHDLAVPIFHGYAHESKCQLDFNPRNKEDFRLVDGENTERLWSELTNFTYITKEMAPANRHDLLVDALIHRGEKTMNCVANRMSLRLKNAREVEAKAQADLKNLLRPLKDQGIDVSDNAIAEWDQQMRSEYARRKKKAVSTWQMDYAILLKKWYSLSSRVAGVAIEPQELEAQTELEKLDEKLQKTERGKKFGRWDEDSQCFKRYLQEASKAAHDEILGKMHQEAVDRAQLILLKKRARGHEEVSRFSKTIQKTNTKLTTLLRHYNAIIGVVQQSYENAKNPDSELYTELPSVNHLPFPVIRDAIRLSNTCDRAEEEIAALSVELPAVLYGYEKLNDSLQQAIIQISPPSNRLQEGVIAVILKKIIENEKRKEALADEIMESLKIQVEIESTYSNSFPSQFIPSESVEGEEEEEEEENEEGGDGQHKDDDYHASDDECAPEDEI